MSLVRTLLGLPSGEQFSGGYGISLGDWFSNTFFGAVMPSTAGKDVDRDSALTISAVYSCVKIISETIASLPMKLKRRLPDGTSVEAEDEPLYWLLKEGPNPHDTTMSFLETLAAHLALRGNAYARVYRNERGELTSLEPIDPDRVTVIWLKGRLLYHVAPMFVGEVETLVEEEMLHVRLCSQNGLTGMSPITYARNTLGLALAQDEYAARLFSNGAIPGGILSSETPMSAEARAANKAAWQEAHGGVKNSHRVAILGGLKWQSVGMTPEDAQYIEGRKFQIEEICRLYRVPQHMVGSLDRSTNNNIEQQSLEFVIHTMRPWFVRFEQTGNKQLLSQRQRNRGLYLTIIEKELYRGDTKTIAEAHRTYLSTGVYSINEVRQDLELNPIEGGDEHLQPLNMTPAGAKPEQNPADPGQNQPEPPQDDSNDDANLQHSRAESVIFGLLREGVEAAYLMAEKAINRQVEKCKAKEFEDWAESFTDIDMPDYFLKRLYSSAAALVALYRDSRNRDSLLIADVVSRYGVRFSRRLWVSMSSGAKAADTPLQWGAFAAEMQSWLEEDRETAVNEYTTLLFKRLKRLALEEKHDAAA